MQNLNEREKNVSYPVITIYERPVHALAIVFISVSATVDSITKTANQISKTKNFYRAMLAQSAVMRQ